MVEIDFITVFNTFTQTTNLEGILTPFLDEKSKLKERQEESIKVLLPAIGVSLSFAIFERFLADHYSISEIFKTSSNWTRFENDINRGWQTVKLSYSNPPNDFYGWEILRNLHKIRHSMMHTYGRIDILRGYTTTALNRFNSDLSNGLIVDRENNAIEPYYDIIVSSKDPQISYIVYKSSILKVFRMVMQDLLYCYNISKGVKKDEKIKLDYF